MINVKSETINPRLCRDCFSIFKNHSRCFNCNSPRIVSHKDLLNLSVAHIDCDAFYASIEKRENPDLKNLPVIVGSPNRGVVTTCCYIARINGVKSAMPIFKAKKLCPNAVFIPPRIGYYKKTTNSIKQMLAKLSPIIEFVSLDEAYIDLKGTYRLHGEAPAVQLARIAKQIEVKLGITISIGLSYNKFLSKLGSELEKPRGFSIIGPSDTTSLLKDKSISQILGVGKKTKSTLETNGITLISDILKFEKSHLKELLGSFGENLWFLARGIDKRKIIPNRKAKSISCEQTFHKNQSKSEILYSYLWDLTEEISSRLRSQSLLAEKISLKLKDAHFRIVVRSTNINNPSNSAEVIFQASKVLLKNNISTGPFRLIGLTLTKFSSSDTFSRNKDFFETPNNHIAATELAIENIRSKFGKNSIIKGRSLKNLS